MLLPIPTRRLVWCKLIGFLPCLIPYAAGFFLGGMLCPEGMAETFGSAKGLVVLLEYLAFVYLIAFFSLVFKRVGALVALALMLGGNVYMSYPLSLLFLSRNFVAFSLALTNVLAHFTGLFVGMHLAIIARLERAAGE